MKFPIVNLEDVITFKGGGTPRKDVPEYWGGDIPWASVKDFKTNELSKTQDFITKAGLDASASNLIPAGHVIIPTRMALGKAAINTVDLAINQDLRALIPKTNIDTKYLLFCILNLSSEIEKMGSGATVKGITQDKLYRLKIPLPLLEDQVRIAHVLGKVEGLIAQRKKDIEQLDQFLKSVFLEMFGPANPDFLSWPLTEMKDLAANHKGSMRTGPFGSNLLHSEFTESGDVAVLGIDNAVKNRFSWDQKRFITKEKYAELNSYRIFPGDVIITIMGTIGRAAVVPDDIPLAINTKHLAAITFDEKKANANFIAYSFHSSPFIVNQLASKNRGAIMSGLNLGLIKETKLRKPPIDLQNRFAKLIAKVDNIRSRLQLSVFDLETLYSTLSQKAFKGELDLTRISIDAKVQIESPLEMHGDIPNPPVHTTDEELFTEKDVTRQDIEAALTNLPGPQSFRSLLDKLEEKRNIDQRAYQAIRAILYQMAAEKKLDQIFDETKMETVQLADGNSESFVPMRLALR